MAKTVFISYRRQDTAPAAGRTYDRLCTILPRSNVFFDVSTIEGGADFVMQVTAAIKQSDTVLIFIGRKWLEPTAEGVVRILHADDHVRAEVRAALQHGEKVLPVLVDGAIMPRPDQLPDDIRSISTKNAMPLRHESFDDDIENIINAILGASKARLWDDKGKLGMKIGYAVGGLFAGLFLLTGIGVVHTLILGEGIAASIGDTATWILLLAGAAGGALLGFFYEARRRRRRLLRLA